jgi:2-methylisocitrate lyase-like PEP mutase family enzyme
VREFESRGVAGIHIEDPEFPKKCGHLEGEQIIPREDYQAKIRAAVAGLDEATARANAALATGADMAFVETPQTEGEVAAVPRLVNGPCLLNVVRGGKTPDIDLRHGEALGYKLAIVPGLLIKSVVGICDKILSEFTATHRHPPPIEEMTVPEMLQRFGADEWDSLRECFRSPLRNAAE